MGVEVANRFVVILPYDWLSHSLYVCLWLIDFQVIHCDRHVEQQCRLVILSLRTSCYVSFALKYDIIAMCHRVVLHTIKCLGILVMTRGILFAHINLC